MLSRELFNISSVSVQRNSGLFTVGEAPPSPDGEDGSGGGGGGKMAASPRQLHSLP